MPKRRGLDAQTHDIVVQALRGGHFLETAAALAGHTVAKVRTWIRLGAVEGSEYEDFARDCRRATAESEDKALIYLREAAAAGDLKAVTWWLERRHPTRWGVKVQHIVRQELDAVFDRIESLEGELGAEVIERVLGAVAGEWGAGGEATEAPEGEAVH